MSASNCNFNTEQSTQLNLFFKLISCLILCLLIAFSATAAKGGGKGKPPTEPPENFNPDFVFMDRNNSLSFGDLINNVSQSTNIFANRMAYSPNGDWIVFSSRDDLDGDGNAEPSEGVLYTAPVGDITARSKLFDYKKFYSSEGVTWSVYRVAHQPLWLTTIDGNQLPHHFLLIEHSIENENTTETLFEIAVEFMEITLDANGKWVGEPKDCFLDGPGSPVLASGCFRLEGEAEGVHYGIEEWDLNMYGQNGNVTLFAIGYHWPRRDPKPLHRDLLKMPLTINNGQPSITVPEIITPSLMGAINELNHGVYAITASKVTADEIFIATDKFEVSQKGRNKGDLAATSSILWKFNAAPLCQNGCIDEITNRSISQNDGHIRHLDLSPYEGCILFYGLSVVTTNAPPVNDYINIFEGRFPNWNPQTTNCNLSSF